jgi:hypothetical protein
LAEIVRVSRAAGATPVWLAFPVRPQVEADFDASYPQAHLAERARESGVPLIDLLPVLKELSARGEDELFYDQCHHTPIASRAVARAVFEGLRGSDAACRSARVTRTAPARGD